MKLVVGAFTAEPTVMVTQDKVPPPERVHDELALGSLYNVTVPETVRVNVAFTVRIALAPTAVKVILEHPASAVTVTVHPFSRKTLSPATGKLAPGAPPEVADHVAVEFQLPEATEKRSAAITENAENDKTIARKNFLLVRTDLIMIFRN